MKSAPGWLRILLLVLPRGFRSEYGEEIRAHVAWMRERQSAGSARVIAYVVFDVLRVGLIERLALAGTMLANSTRLSRHSLAAGALLAFIGTSIGYGAGMWVGFAFVPPALVIFAHGIVGRTVVTSPGHRFLVGLAALTGGCALALAMQIAFMGVGLDPLGLATTRAMLPVFITLVVAASLFGLTGLWQRRIPRVPAAMAALSGLLLSLGPARSRARFRAGVLAVGRGLGLAGRAAVGVGARGSAADAPDMKRVLKWLAIGAGTIVGLLLVAVAVVYALSGRRIAGRFETDPSPVVVTDDSATIAHGERLARIHGCLACHGKNLAGQVAFEQAFLGRFVAPNLTRVSREYSDLDFVRLLRHGVRPNGTGVVGMPSSSFAHLADEDLAAIIAYVRTVPFNDAVLPSTRYGLLARVMLLAGRFDLQPNLMDGSRPPNALPDAQNPEIFGRYLAASTCTECHGADLMGTDGFMATPSLAVVGGYSREEFREFLRTGVALGGRTLAIMSAVAKARFAHFTDDEIDALYAYFETLAAPAEDRRAITPS